MQWISLVVPVVDKFLDLRWRIIDRYHGTERLDTGLWALPDGDVGMSGRCGGQCALEACTHKGLACWASLLSRSGQIGHIGHLARPGPHVQGDLSTGGVGSWPVRLALYFSGVLGMADRRVTHSDCAGEACRLAVCLGGGAVGVLIVA